MHRREFIKKHWHSSGRCRYLALRTLSRIQRHRGKSRPSGSADESQLALSPAKVEGAQAPEFDDSGFERVVIPHTNVRLPWHNFDDKDYEFVSTYRQRFKLPQAARGRRVFVDFEGVMTASTVWINGVSLGEYKGGFTPFSFELTPHLRANGENVLAVQVDSTERADIPPFGYQTFGGIYREIALRVVPATYIDNIFAHPKDVLGGSPSLDVDCFLAGQPKAGGPITIAVELRDGERVLGKET